MMLSKSVDAEAWRRWPIVCPATADHQNVRRDAQGRLWEFVHTSCGLVAVKPFAPVELIDQLRVYEFEAETAAGVS
jgi:hypothetical protein